MTQPAPAQQQQQQHDAAAALTALVGVTTAAGLAAALSSLAGVPLLVATRLVAEAGPLPSVAALGPALRATVASERAYRAAYLVAASRRVQDRLDGGMSLRDALRAEAPTLRAHLAAQANRRRAALAVDKAAARHGLLLGWRARMDSRTSAECRAADGHNFDVTRRPLIGWPGSVHPHCRCRPVAAFAGAAMVDGVTRNEKKAAVA